MKKIYHIYLPSFSKKIIDLRRWYYVYIDGEKMDWWCIDCERDYILMDYSTSNVKFVKIPFYKMLVH